MSEQTRRALAALVRDPKARGGGGCTAARCRETHGRCGTRGARNATGGRASIARGRKSDLNDPRAVLWTYPVQPRF
jgi:hypothetical protein